MRRYNFLEKEQIFEALNKLRTAFLAAKDGSEVEEIIKGILTNDERIKIGRRILISQILDGDKTYEEIRREYKIGKQTILQIQRLKDKYPKCFEMINIREEKVENEYHDKAYVKRTNSLNWKNYIEVTGFKRKDVKR